MGRAHYRAGKRSAGPAKGEDNPEILVQELPERPSAAE